MAAESADFAPKHYVRWACHSVAFIDNEGYWMFVTIRSVRTERFFTNSERCIERSSRSLSSPSGSLASPKALPQSVYGRAQDPRRISCQRLGRRHRGRRSHANSNLGTRRPITRGIGALTDLGGLYVQVTDTATKPLSIGHCSKRSSMSGGSARARRDPLVNIVSC
jgi:hypothetical protein